MKLVVGLGNPGRRYQSTRHNVGFWVVDHLARGRNIRFRFHRDLDAQVAEGEEGEESYWLVKPQSYMNASGPVVRKIVDRFRLSYKDILVILDDIFLDLGVLRIRLKGSSGGQKGLQSIIEACATQELTRLRLGVGSPKDPRNEDWADHVLSTFQLDELESVEKAVSLSAKVSDVFIRSGSSEAYQWLNDFQSRKKSKGN